MDLVAAFSTILVVFLNCCKGTSLESVDAIPRAGQIVCKNGREKPCYKVIYFHDTSRRVNFAEAQEQCKQDGGHLMTILSESEQSFIESLIQSMRVPEGDFWLGLVRTEDETQNSSDCNSLYNWVDGIKPTFWNWYADEPSCGSEACVVMYHQPSALPGVGGLYRFQWNDDRCNMRNNFICKYSLEKTTNRSSTKTPKIDTMNPEDPEESVKKINGTAQKIDENVVHYILIAAIPLLTLLVIFIGVLCCCIAEKRKERNSEMAIKEPSFWTSPNRRNSPNLEVYSVIKRQNEADLNGTRPDIRNTSFRVASGENSPLDNLSGEYDNLDRNHSESGFVTLASTESGFVTNELYELSSERFGRSTESGWVENEIYGY
ncbi:layilin [Xenopus laevis]|uniref:Layilin n=1 Tax=Xenopus laevis TaxID=8355 RepID=A0A8J1LCP3_XENLA|nr:layilin [Xenopus laevis]